MKTEKKILFAFVLNFAFAIFEFWGGLFTGSIAILSDALHDTGDALSIGISLFLEKKSKKQPDQRYTYGYARYSVLASIITMLILLIGSLAVLTTAVKRLLNPTQIHYNGMLTLAVVGIFVNLIAVVFTHKGHSLNQRAVHLHMLEDTLGWAAVLIGGIVMKLTDSLWIDPLLSISVSLFIFAHTLKGLKTACDLFLMKAPKNTNIEEIKKEICSLEEILDVHHFHLWSIDGYVHYATMHIVTSSSSQEMKMKVRQLLKKYGILHITLEFEAPTEVCAFKHCYTEKEGGTHRHSNHH